MIGAQLKQFGILILMLKIVPNTVEDAEKQKNGIHEKKTFHRMGAYD